MIRFDSRLLKQYGAYIRTDISSIKEINGVGTGVIGVLGLAERGVDNEPVEISSYTQLVETFGDGPLVRHGLAMFVGGASKLICVRIGNPTAAQVVVANVNTPTKAYRIVAKEKGSVGKNISYAAKLHTQDTDEDIDDDLFELAFRYANGRGSDFEQSYYFPRYIPVPKDVTTADPAVFDSRYYKGNTEYFLLRNRNDKIVREIPESWTYGITNKDAFLRKVEILKGVDEDLVEFPSEDNAGARIPFPLSIMASVVNYGGFIDGRGYGSSSLITVEDVDTSLDSMINDKLPFVPSQEDELIIHDAFQLTAPDNANGEDGTGFYNIARDNTTGAVISEGEVTHTSALGSAAMRNIWVEGLALLEEEDVNFVQPAYLFNNKGQTTWNDRFGFFKKLSVLILAHVIKQSDVEARKFRTSILGLPYYRSVDNEGKTAKDFLNSIKDVSGLINCDRIQLWAGGFKSSAFSAGVELYGADMLVSFICGVNSAKSPEDSLTFNTIAGIFTDGLEFTFSTEQKNELYTRSLCHVVKRRSSSGATEFSVTHNMTSWTGSPDRGLQLFITRRIVDYMNTFVYKNLEESYIGKRSFGAATAANISTFVNSLLNRLVIEGVLVAYDRVAVVARADNKTVYEVSYDFQPVTEIDWILVTNRLTYGLQ